jgi:hypothetical protein
MKMKAGGFIPLLSVLMLGVLAIARRKRSILATLVVGVGNIFKSKKLGFPAIAGGI